MDTSKKIIKGAVNGRGFTITSAITQWDYGWQFIPEIEDLPPTYRLDFSNEEKQGTALPVYCSTEGAEVPTELIDTGKDVWVWFVRIGDGFGITEYKWRVPNKCKPKTEQDEPTPSQQSSIDQLIVRSNEAVESAEQSASDADASARMALGYAESAQESARQAQEYSTVAISNANSASQSASQASQSATASAQSAEQSAINSADAQDSAEDAQGYAQASAQSASASVNSASQAQGYAQSASASAQSASGYASQAQTSANTASAKAQDASGYAQTASQKATESAQSASQALTYKTDAESAKVASQTAQGLAESARDTAVSAKTDAESARDDAESARDEAQSAVASIGNALAEKAPVITDTASGAVASFSDGADDLPLKSLVVDINPVQDLHGYDSPWPAGGGVNKFDESVFSNYGGVLQTSGVWHFGSLVNVLDKVIWTAPESIGQITVTMWRKQSGAGVQGFRLVINYTDGTSVKVGNNSATGGTDVYSVTTDASKTVRNITGDYGNNQLNTDVNVVVRIGSTAPSAYSPYENICPISGWTQVDVNHSDADMTNPTTITIDLGQTVYGGKLDVLSGKLVIDRAMVDLGTLNYGYDSVHKWFVVRKSDAKRPKTDRVNANIISDTYTVYPRDTFADDLTIDNAIGLTSSSFLIARNLNYTNTSDFITAMNGHQLVYELATPITIQLTPNQINSLYGVNNLWADSGDTEVEYRADTKLYIERLTAPDSEDMIADANITSGQYFLVGNSLYKATSNIANGAQIIVGTNCIRKSLSEALNEINA